MSLPASLPLGARQVSVPTFGLGTCPLGNLFEAVPEEAADATFQAAWDAGVRYYDTSPWYGRGLAELRLGRFLRGKPRQDVFLSTKVGRRFFRPRDRAAFSPRPWAAGLGFDHLHDYTYDGVLRSYEDSLLRLGVNKVDALLIHDLDLGYFDEPTLVRHLDDLERGGIRALQELRAAGEISVIGAGINERGMIRRFLARFPLDVVLVAGRYTLLEQDILDELAIAQGTGAGVVIGGPFNSGILATGPREGARYEYAAAKPELRARVQRLEAACARHEVPLAAAALQFPFGHPAVAAVIPGAVTPGEVRENTAHLAQPIPAALWEELRREGLIHPSAPLPGAPVVAARDAAA
jgi:D-threo-aldose 1-dehydrogenase